MLGGERTAYPRRREARLAAGAGYVYAVCGEMRPMPGLSRHPAAERIDLDADGQIIGLS